MEHFFDKKSYKFCLRCIFSKACSSNASKMHKIGYMRSTRGSQDASRTAQDGFCLRFGRQLEAKLAPCWPLFPLKRVPRRSQDASKTIPRAPQDPIQPGLMGYPCFGRDQNRGTPSALVVFWSIFGRCWLIVGRFLVDFLIILLSLFDRFLIDFGR